jgi:molybdate transport system substrate-binding protein
MRDPGGVIRTALFAVVLCVFAGCGSGGDGEVRVSAAASLTDAFVAMETAFEAAHPDVDILLNLAGSSTLREQILAGSPADVFASADRATMQPVADAGLTVDEPVIFATNSLAIAVPRGNPAGVSGVDDLADPELLVGLCAPAVPCGALAAAALEMEGVAPSVDTFEPDVRALLTKLAAGELDAGVVYGSDVAGAVGRVEAVAWPGGASRDTDYPIAVVSGGANPDDASDFVAFVLSDAGRRVLVEHGFGVP